MKHLFSFVMLLCLAMSINVANAKTYVMITNDAETLDDDEQAAKDWFLGLSGTKEGNFLCYTASEIAAGEDNKLIGVDCVWVNFDKVGSGDVDKFWTNYSGSLSDATFVTKLGDYLKSGGNILFTNHANYLLKEIGRYHKYPEVVGFGAGGNNNDVWDAGVVYGTWSMESQAFDNSTDLLFADIEMTTATRPCGREYKVFHLMSAGWKEDHNCFWYFDLPENNDNKDTNKFSKLKELYGVTPLAMWPHIEDYCGGAIARWEPKDDFKGSCITIGFAAYEWNMNEGGTNTYRGNIEQLTLNALAILAYDHNLSTGVEAVDTDNSAVVATEYYNLQGARIANPENGIYIVKRVMESGKVATSKELIK